VILIVSWQEFAKVRSSNLLRKEGEKSVKFVKIFAVLALAVGALSLGACTHKAPAPAPTTMGTTK